MNNRIDDEKTNLFRNALDKLCSFNIGDEVVARGTADGLARELKDLPVDPYTDPGSVQAWVVVERFVQECYSGVQVHYEVRHQTRDGQFALGRFTEPELEFVGGSRRVLEAHRAIWLQEQRARKR